MYLSTLGRTLIIQFILPAHLVCFACVPAVPPLPAAMRPERPYTHPSRRAAVRIVFRSHADFLYSHLISVLPGLTSATLSRATSL
jgi:hypothetical protein